MPVCVRTFAGTRVLGHTWVILKARLDDLGKPAMDRGIDGGRFPVVAHMPLNCVVLHARKRWRPGQHPDHNTTQAPDVALEANILVLLWSELLWCEVRRTHALRGEQARGFATLPAAQN